MFVNTQLLVACSEFRYIISINIIAFNEDSLVLLCACLLQFSILLKNARYTVSYCIICIIADHYANTRKILVHIKLKYVIYNFYLKCTWTMVGSNKLFKDLRRDYLFPFYESPRKFTKDDELTKSTWTKYHVQILGIANMP